MSVRFVKLIQASCGGSRDILPAVSSPLFAPIGMGRGREYRSDSRQGGQEYKSGKLGHSDSANGGWTPGLKRALGTAI